MLEVEGDIMDEVLGVYQCFVESVAGTTESTTRVLLDGEKTAAFLSLCTSCYRNCNGGSCVVVVVGLLVGYIHNVLPMHCVLKLY